MKQSLLEAPLVGGYADRLVDLHDLVGSLAKIAWYLVVFLWHCGISSIKNKFSCVA